MARIPRAQEMGLGDQTAQVTRGVVGVPTIDQSGARTAAASLDRVGEQVREFSARLQKAEIDRSIAEANVGATDDLDKLKRRLSESQADPKTYEATYAEESGRIINAWAEKVPMGGRDMWLARAKEDQQRGTFEMRSLMRTRQLEGEQAKGIALFEGIRDGAGDLSVSADAYAKKNEQGRQLVADQLATGVITAPAAAKMYAELEDAQVVDNTARFSANVDELIAQGRVAEAEALYQTQMGLNKDGKSKVDPEILMATKKGLASSKLEVEAVESSDRFWAASKGNLATYNELVAGVQDVPKRLKMEARGITLANQAKAAKAAEQDQLQQGLWDHVVKGGTIATYSPSRIAALDPERLGSIRAYENARDAEKGMSAANKAAWADQSADFRAGFEWFARNNPAMFMGSTASWPQDLQQRYAAMTPDDQRAIATKQLEMADKGHTSDAVDKVMQDALNEARRFAPSIMDSAKDNDAKRMQFEGILYRNAKALSAMQGGEPISPDQARKLVLQAMGEYDTKKYGAGVNVALGYMAAEDAAAADPVVWARVAQQQETRLGRKPTKLEIMQAYQAVVAD